MLDKTIPAVIVLVMAQDADITFTDSPAPELIDAIVRGLDRYNTEKTGVSDDVPIAVYVRDGDEVVAGAHGTTYWGWLHIDRLWIADHLRHGGLGTRMLRAIEDGARERGCHSVWLDTFSFQAKPFYERNGYQQFGELDEYPRGNSRHFLYKRLDV